MSGLPRDLVAVWAVLVAATGLTFLVGEDHLVGAGDAAVVALLAITFGKIWLVGTRFMELRDAPALLRRLFHAYAAGVPCALLVVHHAA